MYQLLVVEVALGAGKVGHGPADRHRDHAANDRIVHVGDRVQLGQEVAVTESGGLAVDSPGHRRPFCRHLRLGGDYCVDLVAAGPFGDVAVVEVGVGRQGPGGYRFGCRDVRAEGFIRASVGGERKDLGRLIDRQAAESYPERH